MRKSIILFTSIALAALFACCGNPKIEHRTVQTYPDGKTMLVQDVKDSTIIGETRFYENGSIHYRKVFNSNARPDSIWRYNYPTGDIFATADYTQNDSLPVWMIYDHDGAPYYKDNFDSMRVLEMGMYETPATIVYFTGKHQTELQFYSNGLLRCYGEWADHQRTGLWTFYHPNGQKQTEATFVNGKEDGLYTVFHQNGVPLYIGHYTDGNRSGKWEFYDDNGEIIKTEEYK